MVVTGTHQTFSYLKLNWFPLVGTFSKITRKVFRRQRLIFFYRNSKNVLFIFSTVIFIYFSLKANSAKYLLKFQVIFQYLAWSNFPLCTKRRCVVAPNKCTIAWKCSTQRISKFSEQMNNVYEPEIILTVRFKFYLKLKWTNTRFFPLIASLG